MVAVYVILIPRMHFAAGDPPPLVALTTGDRALRRKTEKTHKLMERNHQKSVTDTLRLKTSDRFA